MPNPDMASERRAFEAKIMAHEIGILDKYDLRRLLAADIYVHHATEMAWQGWLARSAVPPSDGYVLVPVEPTEAMINSGDGELLNGDRSGKEEIANIWKAMISASQSSREG